MPNTWQRATKTDRFIRNTAKLGAADSSFMNPRVPKLLRYYQINHLRRTLCKHCVLPQHIYNSILLCNDFSAFHTADRTLVEHFVPADGFGLVREAPLHMQRPPSVFALCNGTLVCWITITTHKSQILLHEWNTKSFIVYLCNLSLNNILGAVVLPQKSRRQKKMNVETVFLVQLSWQSISVCCLCFLLRPLGVVDVCYMLQTARSSGFYILMDFRRLRYIRTEVQLYSFGLLGFFWLLVVFALVWPSYSNTKWSKVCGHPQHCTHMWQLEHHNTKKLWFWQDFGDIFQNFSDIFDETSELFPAL